MESQALTSVERLAAHEQKLNLMKAQEKEAKKELAAKRKLAYLKSPMSERAIFRYAIMCVISFLLELAVVELAKPDEFKILASVCVFQQAALLWWFGNGRCKTRAGAMIQTAVKWIGYVINAAVLVYLANH